MDRVHQQRMDKTFGRMKYIYDLTRPFILAGRARLRNAVRPVAGQRVLEVGCGTARNLILLARMWPDIRFDGIDISSEMLSYARRQIARHGLDARISLFEGELEDFMAEPGDRDSYDFILFSYSLSMMRDWRMVLRQSTRILKPVTGKLMIAEFGACERWPRPIARRLHKNLSYFQVTPCSDLPGFLASETATGGLNVTHKRLLGGYGQFLEVDGLAAGRNKEISINDETRHD